VVGEGVKFKMGSRVDLQKNVVTCKGQDIQLQVIIISFLFWLRQPAQHPEYLQ